MYIGGWGVHIGICRLFMPTPVTEHISKWPSAPKILSAVGSCPGPTPPGWGRRGPSPRDVGPPLGVCRGVALRSAEGSFRNLTRPETGDNMGQTEPYGKICAKYGSNRAQMGLLGLVRETNGGTATCGTLHTTAREGPRGSATVLVPCEVTPHTEATGRRRGRCVGEKKRKASKLDQF